MKDNLGIKAFDNNGLSCKSNSNSLSSIYVIFGKEGICIWHTSSNRWGKSIVSFITKQSEWCVLDKA